MSPAGISTGPTVSPTESVLITVSAHTGCTASAKPLAIMPARKLRLSARFGAVRLSNSILKFSNWDMVCLPGNHWIGIDNTGGREFPLAAILQEIEMDQ